MSETVAACPECDDSSIHHTSQSCLASDGERYRCTACGEQFEQPNERAPRGHTNAAKGLAQELLDAKASEVSR